MDKIKGTIVHITDKGYGFISTEGNSANIFFHARELLNGQKFFNIAVGNDVEINEVESTPKGLVAHGVFIL